MKVLRRLCPKTKRYTGRRGDEGFTLVELLIVIVILPFVVGAIVVALLGILQNETTTFNKVAGSADANLTSATFARDVQSATQVTTSQTLPSGRGECWPTTSPSWPTTLENASTPLLGLQWGETLTRTFSDGVLSGNSKITSPSQAQFTQADRYSTVTDAQNLIPPDTTISSVSPDGTSASLDATTGTNHSTDPITVSLSKNWVATYWDVPITSGSRTTYDLVRQFCKQSGSGPTCPTCFVSTTVVAHDLPANQLAATVTCANSQCSGSSTSWTPTTGVTSIALSAAEPASKYQFSLSAIPRTSTLGGEGVTALLLTGAGPALNDLNANDSLTVNGALGFNSSSGAVAGPAASTATLAVNTVPGQSTISESGCSGSCSQVTSSFPPGVLTCSGSATCPATVPTASTVPVILSPTSPGLTGPTGACSPAGPNTFSCSPGYYPTPPTVSGNVTFMPGNYTFAGPSPVVVTGSNTSVTFDGGQYTFGAGLSVDPAATNVSLSGTGVFFYFPSGSLSVNGSGDSVQLSPPTSGQYTGIVFYQPKGNSSTLSISGGASGNSLNGVVEAQSAAVNFGSGGDSFSVGTLIAASLTLGAASVTMTVGT